MQARALTLREAAGVLGVSMATLYRMIDAGKLRVVHLAPRTPRVPVAEIERLLGEGIGNSQRAAGDGR